jgi:hypothetical protein
VFSTGTGALTLTKDLADLQPEYDKGEVTSENNFIRFRNDTQNSVLLTTGR